MQKERLVIIDAPAILHRAWHALPKLTDKKGQVVNAVYGFTSVFLRLLREFQPTHIAACFDTAAPTFRHRVYKEYKATRLPQPQEFYDQIPLTKEVLRAFNIPVFEKDGYEADDFIGILSHKYHQTDSEIIIVTGDLDALQLVNKKTKIYFLKQGISEIKIYDLAPRQLIDFKALVGDPSDNIPGIEGIGKKTALDLIQKFGGLEAIYQCLETSGNKEIRVGIKKLLREQREKAFLSKKLVTILKEAPKDLTLEIKDWPGPDMEKIKEIFKRLDFQSLLKRLEKTEINPKQNKIF